MPRASVQPPASPSSLRTAEPRVDVTRTANRYQIEGDTALELWDAMLDQDLSDPTGDLVFGLSEWTVAWTYRYDPSPDGTCGLHDIDVRLRLDLTLPEWSPPRGASRRLVAQWRAYMNRLLVHERGHEEISLDAARHILDALTGIGPRPTCAGIEEQADALADRLWTESLVANEQYDDETGHGVTQGAVWPPPS